MVNIPLNVNEVRALILEMLRAFPRLGNYVATCIRPNNEMFDIHYNEMHLGTTMGDVQDYMAKPWTYGGPAYVNVYIGTLQTWEAMFTRQ